MAAKRAKKEMQQRSDDQESLPAHVCRPALPHYVQRNLLQQGLRVRKAVSDGYKCPAEPVQPRPPVGPSPFVSSSGTSSVSSSMSSTSSVKRGRADEESDDMRPGPGQGYMAGFIAEEEDDDDIVQDELMADVFSRAGPFDIDDDEAWLAANQLQPPLFLKPNH